ncbi:MAG: MBL fold metallo-hydrolase [Alteromonadaceae bacterium]|nr:MAG: MBL fold metallo-hydrolase [Alteromonadaceae bacterium]
MKLLHKKNLFCWSQFDNDRNIDFHSYLWVRSEGNVVFDPLPLTDHDEKHLNSLGKVSHILISNSDHIRDAVKLAKLTGAKIYGPAGEKDSFPVQCAEWLGEAKGFIEGLDVYCLNGSKTEGELAFVIEGETLITGDLIRAHSGGKLCMLPGAKLQDLAVAKESVRRLASIPGIKAVLVGDGWPIFNNGEQILSELVAAI